MTEQEWLEYAKKNSEKLISLLRSYHPVNRQPGRLNRGIPEDHITAYNAEMACVAVRKQIRDNNPNLAVEKTFTNALEHDDWRTINSLLNDAWFGVPESRNSWGIEGFREAVHLIEEPPNSPEYNEDEDD